MDTVVMFGVLGIYFTLVIILLVGVTITYYLVSERKSFGLGMIAFLITVVCLSTVSNIIFS